MVLTVTVAPSKICLTRSVPLARADATAGGAVAVAAAAPPAAPEVKAAAVPAWIKAWTTAAGPVTEMRVEPTRRRATPPVMKITF
jgi:hypothetical protein